MMKTYQLTIGKFLQFWLRISSTRRVQIEFTGGTTVPFNKRATYRTWDKEIQDAIEAHPWFGHWIVLQDDSKPVDKLPGKQVQVSGTPTTKHLLASTQDPPVDPIPEPTPEPEQSTETVDDPAHEPDPIPEPAALEPPPPDAVLVPGITNGQDAKRWLFENRKVAISTLKNNEVIKTVAAEQKVTFPDWK